MHYYDFNIGDYRRDTTHLSPMEHYIYRSLIDWYFLEEKPITQNNPAVLRRLNLLNLPDAEALLNAVFADFFELVDGCWHQKRIDEMLLEYKSKAEANRANGKKGGRPPKKEVETPQKEAETPEINPKITEGFISDNPTESESNPNQEPRTKNHKPIEERRRATRLPDNWQPSPELLAWAKAERPDLDTSKTIASFGDYWRGKAGKDGAKLDWDATFRNWVRNERSTPVQRPFNASGMTAAEEAQREADRRNARRPGPDRGLETLSKSLAAAVPMPPEVRERLAKAQGAAA